MFNSEINNLAPLEVELVRVGGRGDGGYLLPENIISYCDHLVSFGISTEWSFEQHVRRLNPDIKIYAVDRTSGVAAFLYSALRCLTQKDMNAKERLRDLLKYLVHSARFAMFFWGKGIRFERRWVAEEAKTKKDLSISEILSWINPIENVLFKIDIEGAEYEILPSIISSINGQKLNVNCMVIEFHDTYERREEFLNLVNSLRHTLEIVHLHGNNCVDAAPDGFPQVIEITFARMEKQTTSKRTSLPLAGLDSVNDPALPDFEITFYN